MKAVTGSDGSKLYDAVALYDSQLGADCAFSVASDRQLRCLPTVAPDAVRASGDFSDDQCTHRITFVEAMRAGCVAPKYLIGPERAADHKNERPDRSGCPWVTIDLEP